MATNIIKIFHKDGWYHIEYLNEFNQRHREDGPAVIIYDENNKLRGEFYYLNDLKHRIGGPEMLDYETGYCQLWLNGNRATKEQMEKAIQDKEFNDTINELLKGK